jgi:hypothetical protein
MQLLDSEGGHYSRLNNAVLGGISTSRPTHIFVVQFQTKKKGKVSVLHEASVVSSVFIDLNSVHAPTESQCLFFRVSIPGPIHSLAVASPLLFAVHASG